MGREVVHRLTAGVAPVNRLLKENRRFLTDEKVGLHINHLNGNSAVQRLTTEWEVAVLDGLAKVGQVRQPQGHSLLLIEANTVLE